MEQRKIHRKLTTIFSTDVQGYSRLMSEDEAATIRTLTAYKKVISAYIEKHGGRVVDSPGDNLLAEFGSVVHAVQCAVDIQEELEERNEALPENRRMRFRIGINVGDVVVEDERLYGDGVNIAARLESLAEGGGICISGDAYRQVRSRLPFGFEDLGEREVKNIPEPVRVYQVQSKSQEPGKSINEPRKSGHTTEDRWRVPNLRTLKRWALYAVASLVVAAAIIWFVRANWFGDILQPVGALTRAIASKPIVAILPFRNVSEEAGQEYFSRGISDDLTAALSRFRALAVLSPEVVSSSSKNRLGRIDVARRLGARYLVEGNVRKAKKHIRISARLVDALDGKVLWSDNFDRESKEVFEIQDLIVHKIAAILSGRLSDEEIRRTTHQHVNDMGAYELVLKARELIRKRNRRAVYEGKALLEKASKLDPGYCVPLALLAVSSVFEIDYGWTEFPATTLQDAETFAREAANICPSDPGVESVLGQIYVRRGQYNLALRALDKSLKLNPSDPNTYVTRGSAFFWSGDAERSIENFEVAQGFGTVLPPGLKVLLGLAYFLTDRINDSERLLEEAVREKPNLLLGRVALAAVYIKLQRDAMAQKQITKVKMINPLIALKDIGSSLHEKHRIKLNEVLKKAGLQE